MTYKKTYPKTMTDIARLAGVSQAAVSVVLRQERGLPVREGKMKFSEKTRKRILDIVNETGYIPSSIGQALVSQKSSLLGVLVNDMSSSFLPEILEAIEDEASRQRYGSLIMTTRSYAEREINALELMLEKRVDGIILLDYCSFNLPIFERFENTGVPIVYLCKIPPRPMRNSGNVTVDAKRVGELAAKHLMDYGHRQIACIGISKEIFDSFSQHTSGFDINTKLWPIGRTSKNSIENIILKWKELEKSARPTAMFVSSDEYAITIINQCLRTGIKIPQDISIIGIDDIPQAKNAAVPLTTIHQPKYDQGKAACKLLFKMINGGSSEHILFQPELVVRQSTSKYTK